jgi:uncharacterized protein YgiM (DUF1202 family)
MKLLKILLFIPLSLACSLTAPVQDQPVPVIPSSQTVRFVLEAEPSTPVPKTCIVTTTALRLRECAGLECAVTDYLEQGDVLLIHQTEDGWHQITTPAEKSGWVKSNYCGGQP